MCRVEIESVCKERRVVEDIRDMRVPAPGEVPIVTCPHCGMEIEVDDAGQDEMWKTVIEPTQGTSEVARHVVCDKLVRIVHEE